MIGLGIDAKAICCGQCDLAHGASRNAQALAAEAVSIPMAAGVESLNAAVATAVLLFEVARQRRLGDR